jgi:hypothetical protein
MPELPRDFPNHQKVRRGLEGLLEAPALAAYDEAVKNICRHHIALASAHLAAARPTQRHWRTRVSRAYYAAYSASRAVRFYVAGGFSSEVEDHKKVADLPKDFPRLADWNDTLTQMRHDRNLADYDAWPDCREQLNKPPSRTVDLASEFVQETKSYLHARGVLV